jgi:spermidine/putrescine transport system substrate-binding protein
VNPEKNVFERRFRRRDFLKVGALAAGTGILAACGADESDAEQAAPTQPTHPPIEQEPGDLHVFEWSGYEVPDLFQPYVRTFPDKKPKFTFLESTVQALGKVRAGFSADIVHPCNGYVQDFVALDAFQPWDASLIPNFKNLNQTLAREHGQVDGKQYYIPLDWGFDSILYRADKVEPREESFNLLYDERFAGKISWWDNQYNLIIGGLTLGVADAWNMTDEELDAVKEFLISKKKIVRKFWTSQTELDQDFQAGNVWIVGDAWGGSFTAAKAKGIDAVYMDPKEGRISWTCGFMLFKDTKNFRHAHEFVGAWASEDSALWLTNNYAYGHTNTALDLSKVDAQLIETFKLDDPEAIDKANIDKWIPRRQVYGNVWDEVKAA